MPMGCSEQSLPSRLRIVAQSGRALAQAARARGFEVAVADLFGDEDTRHFASDFQQVAAFGRRGFSWGALERAVIALGSGPIVIGPGFEDRPELIERLGTLGPVIGCSASSVTRAKDPFHLAALAEHFSVPFAEVSRHPGVPGIWLRKRQGGAGGGHVRRWHGGALRKGEYTQRFAPGVSYGLSFVVGAERCTYLGAFRQLRDPTAHKPYRFGGLIGPLALESDFDLEHPPIRLNQADREAAAQPIDSGAISDRPDVAIRGTSALEHPPIRLNQADREAAAQPIDSGAISDRPDVAIRGTSALEIAERLAPLLLGLGLRGLISVDCVIDPPTWHMIEINPRPGFALDLLRHSWPDVFAAHVAACMHGEYPPLRKVAAGLVGGRVVYAASRWVVPQDMIWPDNVTDLPKAGSVGPKGVPIVTVWAKGVSEHAVQQALAVAANDLSACIEVIEHKVEMDTR